MNVRGIQRNMKNVVYNFSDAQVKVREATSNDPWGPSSTLMSEIADLTYNVVAFSEIMQMIWKRLNDHGRNWRHVYKALVLLEYLIKTGSDKVAQQCRENIFAIQTLKDFQHFEENKDHGMNVREKSKLLVSLLKDDERLKVERARALKAKERFAQSLSYAGGDLAAAGTNGGTRHSHSYTDSLSAGGAAAAGGSLNPELESARPQTLGEEELQLQLALAMSKEEHEAEEKVRRNEEIRLQMAIKQSQVAGKPVNERARSALEDLMSLNLGTPAQIPQAPANNDPWASPTSAGGAIGGSGLLEGSFNNSQKPLIGPPPSSSSSVLAGNDPWSPVPPPSTSVPVSANNDPWTTPTNSASALPPRPPSVEVDAWAPKPAGVAPLNSISKSPPPNNDPWKPVSTNGDQHRLSNTSSPNGNSSAFLAFLSLSFSHS